MGSGEEGSRDLSSGTSLIVCEMSLAAWKATGISGCLGCTSACNKFIHSEYAAHHFYKQRAKLIPPLYSIMAKKVAKKASKIMGNKMHANGWSKNIRLVPKRKQIKLTPRRVISYASMPHAALFEKLFTELQRDGKLENVFPFESQAPFPHKEDHKLTLQQCSSLLFKIAGEVQLNSQSRIRKSTISSLQHSYDQAKLHRQKCLLQHKQLSSCDRKLRKSSEKDSSLEQLQRENKRLELMRRIQHRLQTIEREIKSDENCMETLSERIRTIQSVNVAFSDRGDRGDEEQVVEMAVKIIYKQELQVLEKSILTIMETAESALVVLQSCYPTLQCDPKKLRQLLGDKLYQNKLTHTASPLQISSVCHNCLKKGPLKVCVCLIGKNMTQPYSMSDPLAYYHRMVLSDFIRSPTQKLILPYFHYFTNLKGKKVCNRGLCRQCLSWKKITTDSLICDLCLGICQCQRCQMVDSVVKLMAYVHEQGRDIREIYQQLGFTQLLKIARKKFPLRQQH